MLNSKRQARHRTRDGRLEEGGTGGYVAGGVAGPGTCAVASSAGDRDFFPACLRCSPPLDAGTGKREERAAGPAGALPGLEETSGRARFLCGLPVDFGPLGRARAGLRMEKGQAVAGLVQPLVNHTVSGSTETV